MSTFRKLLREASPAPGEGRRWLFVPYDQLSDGIGPLARERPQDLGIVLVENPDKAARRPYHRQKLALVLANLRHFALEQARRAVQVRHVVGRGSYADILEPVIAELGPLEMQEAAEWEMRQELAPLVESGRLRVLPHEGWLTTPEQFRASQKGPPWRMDAFYRHVRRETRILMEKGKPVGGKFSFDPENRKVWKGEPPAPVFPHFPGDPVKDEVGDLIRTHFAGHPGELCLDTLPATRDDAERLWSWAARECLPWFGPFEDAMSTRSPGLFHSRTSPLVNLHRLLPRRLVEETAVRADLPLPSKEGFVRQILGWREYVRHVHRETDGFRTIAEHPSYLGASRPLPDAYWGKKSGLFCLDTVVEEVWREGWSHHITRLMVLSNLATLLDVSPRELSDWFWFAYIDAYDWVVEPNVLAMGTFAVGDLMTTKPYVSGSAYIDKMSDSCGACRLDPRTTCPVTNLYWAFLERHQEKLQDNPRMFMMMRSLGKRSGSQKAADRAVFSELSACLQEGREWTAGQSELF